MRDRDKLDLTPGEWSHVGKLAGLGRKRPKKTDVFELHHTDLEGLHLRRAHGSRKHVRGYHAFECMDLDCLFDFRLRPSKDPKVLQHGRQVSCPACGSLYVEWLTFEVDPRDVYLRNDEEEEQLPWGSPRILGKATHP